MQTTTETKPRRNRWGVTSNLTLDDLCKLLGVRDTDKWLDDWDTQVDYYDAELSAEENQRLADEARDEAYKAYTAAVLSVAERLFDNHKLKLDPVRKRVRGHEFIAHYRITPSTTWEEALSELRETINGVGYFHFSTNKELRLSGPYTARQAVLSHIHYVPRWQEVYEGGKASGLVDRELRRR